MDVSLMRTITLSGTVCGLALAITSVSVGNDFDALLRDLSFGDAPAIEQSPAQLSQTQQSPAPSPSSAFNAEADDIAAIFEPTEAEFAMPVSKKIPAISASTALDALDEPVATPQLEAVGPPQPKVNFNELFTSQDIAPTDAAVTPIVPNVAPMVDPIPMPMVNPMAMAGPMAGSAGCCDNGCGPRDGCNGGLVCRPHVKPNLPSSTFLQYFRSNRCYSNVWDGYRQKCGLGHHHLHGTCDCYDPNREGCLGVKRAGCQSCDGSCDR